MTRTVRPIALVLLVAVAPLVGALAPAAAAAPSAGATAGSSQADAVEITEFDAPEEATAGERITVTATAENTGDQQATVTITYRIDGVTRASASRTIDPGQSTTVTFAPTVQRSLDPGTYDHGVFVGTSDRGRVAAIEIVDPGSASFAVSGFQGPASTNAGATVTARAIVENTGTAEGSTTLQYRIGDRVVASREVSLVEGTSVAVTFRADVPDLPPGTYRQGIYVGSSDEGSTGQLVIGTPSARFEVLSVRGPGEATPGESVSATATVRNTANSRATQAFEYRIGGRVVDTREVTLPSGQVATIEFDGTVPNLAAGTYLQGVFQGSSNAGLTRSIQIRGEGASFSVTSLRAPSRADVDDQISATVTVRNTGDARGSTTLRYRIDGTTIDTERVTLDGGARANVTLRGTVPDRATGTYRQGVFVDDTDRGLTSLLRISRETQASEFRISNLDAPSEAAGGEEITVRASVRNAGSQTERVTIEYRIGTRVVDDTRVELRAGRSTTVRFDVTVPNLRDGIYRQGVFVDGTDRGQTTSLRISDRPRFRVTNFEGPRTARVGDRVSVDARIENTGNSRDTQEIEYRIGSRVVAERDLRLNGGERRTITLEGTVPSVSPGTYRQGVFAGSSSSTQSLVVERGGAPRASFRISGFEGDSGAQAGESVSASATVRNTGNTSGSVTLDYRIDGRVLASQRVTLDPGQQRTVSFDATVPQLDAGTYRHGVFIAGTTQGATASLSVEAGESRFSVSNVRAPASAGPGDRITVQATVTNSGQASGQTTIQYRLDGERLASTSVSLAAGEETSVSFEVTVPDLEAGAYQHGVFVGGTDRGTTTSLTVETDETPTASPTPSPSPSPSPTPSPTPTPTETTTTGSPGFGLPAALAALAALLVGTVVRRRRRR